MIKSLSMNTSAEIVNYFVENLLICAPMQILHPDERTGQAFRSYFAGDWAAAGLEGTPCYCLFLHRPFCFPISQRRRKCRHFDPHYHRCARNRCQSHFRCCSYWDHFYSGGRLRISLELNGRSPRSDGGCCSNQR